VQLGAIRNVGDASRSAPISAPFSAPLGTPVGACFGRSPKFCPLVPVVGARRFGPRLRLLWRHPIPHHGLLIGLHRRPRIADRHSTTAVA
jgi:hypothetical protein